MTTAATVKTDNEKPMAITYATVGVGRIQAFLARSRHLWGRRGASEELVRLTALPGTDQAEGIPEKELVVSKILGKYGLVDTNEEGLDLDGVVSLRSKDDSDKAAEQVKQAANELAMTISSRLPGVTVTVRHITSKLNYATLVSPAIEASGEHWNEKTWYPVPHEFPAVRLCDECRVDFASRTTEVHNHKEKKKLRLCAGCFQRFKSNDHFRNPTLRTADEAVRKAAEKGSDPTYPSRFTAEAWLLRRLNEKRKQDKQIEHTEDFEDLGQIKRPESAAGEELRGRTHEGNHIALIFADGNGMGGLFESLLAKAAGEGTGSTEGVREVSKRIKKATSDALLAATEAIMTTDDSKCPVVPHINGGDDVLVSVTADRAWKFFEHFLTTLQEPLRELSDQTGKPLSMSAGMVICKGEYPFGNQVELAEQLMRRAKAHVLGNGWSFTWLDVTNDGPDVDAHGVWTLDEFKERKEAIDHLRSVMKAHGESALGGALAADAKSRGLQLAHLERRMDGVKGFLTALDIANAKDITDEQVALISDIKSIGRWWR